MNRGLSFCALVLALTGAPVSRAEEPAAAARTVTVRSVRLPRTRATRPVRLRAPEFSQHADSTAAFARSIEVAQFDQWQQASASEQAEPRRLMDAVDLRLRPQTIRLSRLRTQQVLALRELLTMTVEDIRAFSAEHYHRTSGGHETATPEAGLWVAVQGIKTAAVRIKQVERVSTSIQSALADGDIEHARELLPDLHERVRVATRAISYAGRLLREARAPRHAAGSVVNAFRARLAELGAVQAAIAVSR